MAGKYKNMNVYTFYTDYTEIDEKKILDYYRGCADGIVEVPPEQYDSIAETAHGGGNIVRGCFSYEQARIIAGFKLIDAIELCPNAVSCGDARGISFVLLYSLSVWTGCSVEEALSNASGKVNPLRTDLGSVNLSVKKKPKLASGSDIAKMAAPKIAKVLFNIARVGPRVILRSAFELLRANMITRFLSVVMLILFDSYSLVRRRISKKQFAINFALALMLMVGGTAGWEFGNYAVGLIFVENMILGIIAGLIGAGMFGALAGMVGEKVIGRFIKDDTAEMLEIFNKEFVRLAGDYLLNQDEAEYLLGDIVLKPQFIKNIFVHSSKEDYADSILEPHFEDVKSMRRKISEIPDA